MHTLKLLNTTTNKYHSFKINNLTDFQFNKLETIIDLAVVAPLSIENLNELKALYKICKAPIIKKFIEAA